jgi:peptide/nickel transport system substrate-binding protein
VVTRRLGLTVLMVVIVLTMNQPIAIGQGARRDVVIGLIGFPESLNPAFARTNVGGTMVRAFMDTEVALDREYRLQPVLIEQVPTLTNGLWKLLPDGKMQLTWKLKRGVRWQDGAPLTADDVLFSYAVAMDQRVPIESREIAQRIEKIEAPDPLTVIVTYKERYAYAGMGIATLWGILPKHVLQQAYEQNPSRLGESPFGINAEATIGNGPFVVKSIVAGSEVVMEANPSYHRGRVPLNRIVFRIFQDVNALFASVISGAVDVTVPSPGGLSFTQALELDQMVRQGRARGIGVVFTPTCLTKAIIPDHASEFFRDKRVRQALSYGTDRKAIVDGLFQGKQVVAYAQVPETHPAFSRAAVLKFDVARAKTLLSEAGWQPGPDGVLGNSKGQRFSVRLTVKSESGDDQSVEQVLQQQWRRLGIETKIQNLTEREISESIFHRKDPPPIYYGDVFTSCSQTVLQFRYHSSRIPSAANGYTGFNIKAFNSPEGDRIALLHDSEVDRTKRIELLRQFQRVFVDELPEIPVYHVSAVEVVRQGLLGVQPIGETVMQGQITRNISEWHWQ